MNLFKRKFALPRVLSYLALTACALAVLVAVKCSLPTRVPSDQELIAAFQAHQRAFEQIQPMAAKDMQNGLYIRWHQESWWCPGSWWCRGSSKPPGMSASRWKDYGNLISQIRPKVESIAIDYNGTISFVFAGEGGALSSGWSKGIAYIPPDVDLKREGVPLPDLSEAPRLPANEYIREVEPAWFLFYQRD